MAFGNGTSAPTAHYSSDMILKNGRYWGNQWVADYGCSVTDDVRVEIPALSLMGKFKNVRYDLYTGYANLVFTFDQSTFGKCYVNYAELGGLGSPHKEDGKDA